MAPLLGIEARPPCRSPSRHRDARRPWRGRRRSLPCDFSFSGVTLAAQSLPPLAEEKADTLPPASSVIDFAVGDQRHRAQASARRRAGAGIGRPDLAQLVAESEMAKTVRGRAARLRPRCVGLRRRELDRPAGLGRIDRDMCWVGDDGDALARQLVLVLGEGILELRLSEFSRSLLPQPATLTDKAARSPAPIRLMPFPRVIDPSATSSHPSGSRAIATWCSAPAAFPRSARASYRRAPANSAGFLDRRPAR